MKQKNFIIIISSPSGAGKTSLTKQLLVNDKKLSLSVSVTTRPKRPGEIDGKDYLFVSKDNFDQMCENDEFAEHALVYGNHYGSLSKQISDKLANSQDVLFDIDWQGAKSLQEKFADQVVTIFILPPSLAELKARLKKRGQDSDEVVEVRMEKAKSDISKYNLYDYVLINQDFDLTLAEISIIIEAERFRRRDYTKFIEEI